MTKRSKPVFLGRWLAEIFVDSTGPWDVMLTLATAPTRQFDWTDAAERTILNCSALTAAFAPPAKLTVLAMPAAAMAAPARAPRRQDNFFLSIEGFLSCVEI